MQAKFWNILAIILILVVFFGFRLISGPIDSSPARGNRTEIVYELKFPAGGTISTIDKRALQAETIRVVTQRLRSLSGQTDVSVRASGDMTISVVFPKSSRLVEVKSILGAEGRTQLFWAKNLLTEKNRYRRFELDSTSSEKNRLDVMFIDRFDKSAQPFGMADPRYRKVLDNWVMVLDSGDIAKSFPATGSLGPVPSMRFTSSGAKKLEAWCRKYRTECENLAFVLDGKVISVAPLKVGTILTDSAYIDGKFDKDYVARLCAMLGAGRLPVRLVEKPRPAN